MVLAFAGDSTITSAVFPFAIKTSSLLTGYVQGKSFPGFLKHVALYLQHRQLAEHLCSRERGALDDVVYVRVRLCYRRYNGELGAVKLGELFLQVNIFLSLRLVNVFFIEQALHDGLFPARFPAFFRLALLWLGLGRGHHGLHALGGGLLQLAGELALAAVRPARPRR